MEHVSAANPGSALDNVDTPYHSLVHVQALRHPTMFVTDTEARGPITMEVIQMRRHHNAMRRELGY